VKQRAADILSRQDVQDMVDSLREREPAAVNDVIPELASVGQVQQVLRQLLTESVPIRDLGTIMEALADGIRATQSLEDAVEVCRLALSRIICGRYADEDGSLRVITVHPDIEKRCLDATVRTSQGMLCGLQVGLALRVLNQVRDLAEQAMRHGSQPVLLTSPQARRSLRQLISRDFPGLPVLSHVEVPSGVGMQVIGQIAVENELAVAS
jgi:flagellar biosynthesis protein FlhA